MTTTTCNLAAMGDQSEFTAASTKKNTVVVKVGMVGDSQIGKTSLMVKYVEGTFDEDYIQTLGTASCFVIGFCLLMLTTRSKLYGEDDIHTGYRNHI